MNTLSKTLIASSMFALAASGGSFAAGLDLTPAGQCMLEKHREIINTKAGTAEVVEVDVDAMQKECEEKTGTKVKDQRLLKKGMSNFRAGGTAFLYK
jgi:Fe2+ or Zn2+ uptake regulation protein